MSFQRLSLRGRDRDPVIYSYSIKSLSGLEVPAEDLPIESAPLAGALNSLLTRLREAQEAECGFAANAAYEMRTPLAGAIAQTRRLRSETGDPSTEARAADIAATLQRLVRHSERFMQLERAEGGQLRTDQSADLRGVAPVVVDDIGRLNALSRITMSLPDRPVLSDLDPDAFGILRWNLIENALLPRTADSTGHGILDGKGETCRIK